MPSHKKGVAPAAPALLPALRLAPALTAALSAALLAGCGSLATRPAGNVTGLAGHWAIDPARSDDFNAHLDKLLNEHRRKLRERSRSVENASAADQRGVAPLLFSQEEPARERQRMAEELALPASLTVALAGAGLSITAAGEPERRFVPGERLTRIDVSGTALLDCGWKSSAFLVNAHYVHKAERSWRYQLDPATGELQLSFAGSDPEYGRLELQAHYHRVP